MTIITVSDRERELMKTVARSARKIDELEREIEGWKQDQKENLQIQVDMQAEINELLYRLKVAEEAQRCECSMDEACRFARERDELKAKLAETEKDYERFRTEYNEQPHKYTVADENALEREVAELKSQLAQALEQNTLLDKQLAECEKELGMAIPAPSWSWSRAEKDQASW